MRQRRVMLTVMEGVCQKQYVQLDWEFIYLLIEIRFSNTHDPSG